MYKVNFLSTLLVIVYLTGCASVSSSSVPVLPEEEWTSGPIYVTTYSVPRDAEYEIVGNVKANARVGYGSVESLYPLLAEEARKVGANAVVDVEGGRAPSAFSWAAPFTSGTAIKVQDVDALEKHGGQYYR